MQTTLEQADTTQEEGAEPDVAMETGVVTEETVEGGGEVVEEEEEEDDDEDSGSQNDDGID